MSQLCPCGKEPEQHVLRVRFDSTEEFLEELNEAPPNVERLVRVTTDSALLPGLPAVHRHFQVTAGYLRSAAGVLQLIELITPCGVDGPAAPSKARDTAEERRVQLSAFIGKLGLEVRGGRYGLLVAGKREEKK